MKRITRLIGKCTASLSKTQIFYDKVEQMAINEADTSHWIQKDEETGNLRGADKLNKSEVVVANFSLF